MIRVGKDADIAALAGYLSGEPYGKAIRFIQSDTPLPTLF